MKLKKRTEKEKRNELYQLMVLDGKSIDEVKREVFLFRILAIFMLVLSSGFTFAALNFDTNKWGYYGTDGLKPVMVYFWICFLMSIFMAVHHNHKYNLLINRQ